MRWQVIHRNIPTIVSTEYPCTPSASPFRLNTLLPFPSGVRQLITHRAILIMLVLSETTGRLFLVWIYTYCTLYSTCTYMYHTDREKKVASAWRSSAQKPNSWMYNFVEVSGQNLESYPTWGFRIQSLHYTPVSNHICSGGEGWLWIARRKALTAFVPITFKNLASGVTTAAHPRTYGSDMA
jgi:hypothetical protein